jgi:RNA polymerase sigma-70 factor (ECF subfamily)
VTRRSDPTDEELARTARAGQPQAFAELVKRYERSLFRFLRMRTASVHDAEELLQDVLLRGWTHLDRYDPTRPFSTWIYTLAVRQAASRRRRRQLPAATDHELDDLSDGGELPPDQLDGGDGNVWDVASRLLSAEPRSALWLCYAEGRSAREIGAILGKREGAVRVMLHRAREKLAAHLTPPVTTSRRS